MNADADLLLVHDGSLPGFLCAVCEFFNGFASDPGRTSSRVIGPGAEPALFEATVAVPRDDGRAARFWSRFRSRLGDEISTKVLRAFFSDIDGVDSSLARIMARLWAEGQSALDELGDSDALLVEKASARHSRETHRMLGLVRFRELADKSLLALIEPDCDVLAFVAPHFAARLPGLRWAIRDLRRGKAAVHEPGAGWRLGVWSAPDSGGEVPAGEAGPDSLPLSADEMRIEDYWRGYFKAVAIRERENLALQASFMPKKYRKHLTEMDIDSGRPIPRHRDDQSS